MIEALGHPVFYIAFWVIILGYAAWRLWRIERLLVSIATSLLELVDTDEYELNRPTISAGENLEDLR